VRYLSVHFQTRCAYQHERRQSLALSVHFDQWPRSKASYVHSIRPVPVRFDRLVNLSFVSTYHGLSLFPIYEIVARLISFLGLAESHHIRVRLPILELSLVTVLLILLFFHLGQYGLQSDSSSAS